MERGGGRHDSKANTSGHFRSICVDVDSGGVLGFVGKVKGAEERCRERRTRTREESGTNVGSGAEPRGEIERTEWEYRGEVDANRL